ncbi:MULTISPECIES: hypothetical protein [Pseudomonas]|jgi:serine/threonine protein phosphatase PrpC|uniref:hypothetical protein n=1 Tax=Pseudomonas TaxID=286 RepID=UPI0018E723F3|nr:MULTISPECIES: hypothetical protein [Pseudomonas]MBJ2216027.1 hypothetical protein [Pseudomonas carnis]MBP5948169.1 hypothetical protein [Pseudomonas sp. P9(2020)]
MRYAIVITDDPDTAYRYSMLFKPFGLATKAVNSNAPMLSCILNPSSVLVLVEDGFIENTSAHTLIDLIRNTPGSNPQIPIIRVWKKLVLAVGAAHDDNVATLVAPVTSTSLNVAMRRIGLIQ